MSIPVRLIQLYYAATVVFLLLDFVFHINLRVVFLDGFEVYRLVYYAACIGIFLLTLWRPPWSGVLGGVESLITLSALILTTASRVLVPTANVLDGAAPVSFEELMNFVIAGSVAWLGWYRAQPHFRALSGPP